MQGNKTHEQQVKILERKDESHRGERRVETEGSEPSAVSRSVHQESRDHNKHNDPGQSGHKPQKHSPAEEKQ